MLHGLLVSPFQLKVESFQVRLHPQRLGFAEAEVQWTVVPFNNAFAPGPKEFDIDIPEQNLGARMLREAAVPDRAGER